MRSDLILMASMASAFPFMSERMSVDKRMQDLESRTSEASKILGREAVNAAAYHSKDKRQLISGLLNGLGGGLDGNGLLKPLTGILAKIDLPTPQPFGLKEVPGDDPNHQFKAPGPTDVRGLCPSLNTLANYNFISRTGITSLAESSNGIQQAWGFGYDLSTFLAALGLIAGGDLPTGKFSIGGADSRVPNTIGPALGIDKHGTFEIDGSISRQDAYFGNQADFIPSRWQAIRKQAESAGGGYFGLEMWVENQKQTYLQSRNTNPQANLGAKYFAVSLAERAFMFRAFPNGTTPEIADAANIEPFWLENRFPKEWFRRATPYGLANLAEDLVNLYAGYPFELGVNNGLDSFTPTGEDLSGQSASDVMCFVLTNIFDTVPGSVQPTLANNIDTFAGFVSGVVSPFFGQFNCPAVNTFSKPGASCETCTDPSGNAADPTDNSGLLADTPGPGKPLTTQ